MRTSSGVGNSARKILSFYRINFAFVPPYRVLVDGPTIYDALTRDMYLKEALPRLLGAVTHVVVTACVVKWLREQGESHSGALLFAKRATRIGCAHKGGDGSASVADCLSARLRAQDNDNKFISGLTDPALLNAIGDIPGVPVVSIVNGTKLILRPPSKATLSYVQQKASAKTLLLSEADKALVEKAKEAERLAREANRPVRQKRKRAKGPNPLSVKKPKIMNKKNTKGARSEVDSVVHSSLAKRGLDNASPDDESGDNVQKKKRNRKRKRSSDILRGSSNNCEKTEVVHNAVTNQNQESKSITSNETNVTTTTQSQDKKQVSHSIETYGLSTSNGAKRDTHMRVLGAQDTKVGSQKPEGEKSFEMKTLESGSLGADESTNDICEQTEISLGKEANNSSTKPKDKNKENIEEEERMVTELKFPPKSDIALLDEESHGDERKAQGVVDNIKNEDVVNEPTPNSEPPRKKKQRKNRRRPKKSKLNHQ